MYVLTAVVLKFLLYIRK